MLMFIEKSVTFCIAVLLCQILLARIEDEGENWIGYKLEVEAKERDRAVPAEIIDVIDTLLTGNKMAVPLPVVVRRLERALGLVVCAEEEGVALVEEWYEQGAGREKLWEAAKAFEAKGWWRPALELMEKVLEDAKEEAVDNDSLSELADMLEEVINHA